MAIKFRFLRHAQSTFNSGEKLCKDSPLSKVGIEQAQQMTGHVDLIICSCLRRTKQTIQHSRLTYAHRMETDLCREIKQSICDFLEHEDETQTETHQWKERFLQFIGYVKAAVALLKPKSVLIVSHAGFIVHFLNLNHGLSNCQFVDIDNSFFD